MIIHKATDHIGPDIRINDVVANEILVRKVQAAAAAAAAAAPINNAIPATIETEVSTSDLGERREAAHPDETVTATTTAATPSVLPASPTNEKEIELRVSNLEEREELEMVRPVGRATMITKPVLQTNDDKDNGDRNQRRGCDLAPATQNCTGVTVICVIPPKIGIQETRVATTATPTPTDAPTNTDDETRQDDDAALAVDGTGPSATGCSAPTPTAAATETGTAPLASDEEGVLDAATDENRAIGLVHAALGVCAGNESAMILPLSYYDNCQYDDEALESVIFDDDDDSNNNNNKNDPKYSKVDDAGSDGVDEAKKALPKISDRFDWRVLPPGDVTSPIDVESLTPLLAEPSTTATATGDASEEDPAQQHEEPAPTPTPTPLATVIETETEAAKPSPKRLLCSFRKPCSKDSAIEIMLPNGLLEKARGEKEKASTFVMGLLESHRFDNRAAAAKKEKRHQKRNDPKNRFAVTVPVYSSHRVGRRDASDYNDGDVSSSSSCSSTGIQLEDLVPPEPSRPTSKETVIETAAAKWRYARERHARTTKEDRRSKRREEKEKAKAKSKPKGKKNESKDKTAKRGDSKRDGRTEERRVVVRNTTAPPNKPAPDRERGPPGLRRFAPDPPGVRSPPFGFDSSTKAAAVETETVRFEAANRGSEKPLFDDDDDDPTDAYGPNGSEAPIDTGGPAAIVGDGDGDGSVFFPIVRKLAETLNQQKVNRTRLYQQKLRHQQLKNKLKEQRRAGSTASKPS